MKTPWLKVLFALSFVVLFAACGTGGKIGNVLIDLAGWESGATPSQLNVTLRYSNENVFAIAIAGSRGKLYLNNEYVGSFSSSDPVGMPQLTSVTRPGVVTVEKPEVLERVRNGGQASVSYRLESVMRMEVSEDKSSLRSKTSGQLDAAALRKAK